MKNDINPSRIYKERINDIIIRGKNHLVIDFYNTIYTLDECPVSYNNKWKYIKPKTYIKFKKNKSKNISCAIL
tara:strand:- start:317 stop:535 length:219 start_codon:yes stop_codon:yes gene_type:complete